MRRGLRIRLALTHLVVAVLAVVVVAAIVLYSGSRRFDSYLSEVQRARSEAVVGTLTQTYSTPDGWDATAIYALSRVATLSNVDVAVYSPEGQLVFTVQGRHGDSEATGGGGAGPNGTTPSPQATALSRDQFEVQSYPITIEGEQVATAEIYAPRSARAAAESAYQSDLTRNLLIAAALAAGLALLVSLVISRRITGPLEELADAADEVAGGNLDARVAPRGDDEVAALATAFNTMADRLARDEQWRRDMTNDLSLELRTPLASIESRVKALEDGVVPATPENLRVIGEEVERLGRLLSALRGLNELEGEDLTIENERIDLAGLVRDVAAQAEPAYAAKGVVLASDLQAVTVVADRDRLVQVIANLLDNALKFTPAGGHVALRVDAAEGSAAESAGVLIGSETAWARLTVADDGPGIDPVDLPFVFDRFYRAQAARGTPGAGLGLAICRALVEAHGGSITVADRPEGGAVFTVLLPCAD